MCVRYVTQHNFIIGVSVLQRFLLNMNSEFLFVHMCAIIKQWKCGISYIRCGSLLFIAFERLWLSCLHWLLKWNWSSLLQQFYDWLDWCDAQIELVMVSKWYNMFVFPLLEHLVELLIKCLLLCITIILFSYPSCSFFFLFPFSFDMGKCLQARSLYIFYLTPLRRL